MTQQSSDRLEQHRRMITRDRLQRDRNSYLTAVAMHHARVAQMACDMLRMCRPETWNTEYLETLAAEIDKSHIDAFGVSMVEPLPSPQEENYQEAKRKHERFAYMQAIGLGDPSMPIPQAVKEDSQRAHQERMEHPRNSCCGRCCRPWACVKDHSTMIDERSAMFPLCQSCWEPLTPEERLPYYLALRESWLAADGKSPYTSDQITRAVLAEGMA